MLALHLIRDVHVCNQYEALVQDGMVHHLGIHLVPHRVIAWVTERCPTCNQELTVVNEWVNHVTRAGITADS